MTDLVERLNTGLKLLDSKLHTLTNAADVAVALGLRDMLTEPRNEIERLRSLLAEADALLLMTKWSVLCVAEDAYRAHRLDISDSQYALLNRIDAFRAADSASYRENDSHD